MPSPAGVTPWSTIPVSGNADIDALVASATRGSGYGAVKYGAGTPSIGVSLTYSFPEGTAHFASPYWEFEAGSGALDSTQRIAVAEALQAWADVANVRFTQVPDTATGVGDLRFAATFGALANEAAHAYLPGSSAKAGDVWLSSLAQFSGFAPGQSGYKTLLHEIGHALGLKHPFQPPVLPDANADAMWFTVMSYSFVAGVQISSGNASFHPTTPMPLDIAAIQYVYGKNLAYHVGDDVYTFREGQDYFQTIWDAGGNDTMAYVGNGASRIDLRPGAGSDLDAGRITFATGNGATYRLPGGNVYTAYGTWIENATGGSGGDQLIGNELANRLTGGAGGDLLQGGDGNDSLDGGWDVDTAAFGGAKVAYTILTAPDGRSAVAYEPRGADGLDVLSGIEQASFAGATTALRATDSPLEYLASYPDLMTALGANAQAGFDHYVSNGYAEGRSLGFNGLEYIASYADLTNAFGTNVDAGAQHYIVAGRFEGRSVTFDGLEYIASYADLTNAFGTNVDAGTQHYIIAGRFEGRSVTFDGLEYIASYADLISGFGPNSDVGTMHYISHGRFEGRTVTFDPAQYLANYADLRAAFGTDLEAATNHYIVAGYHEGRTDDPLS